MSAMNRYIPQKSPNTGFFVFFGVKNQNQLAGSRCERKKLLAEKNRFSLLFIWQKYDIMYL